MHVHDFMGNNGEAIMHEMIKTGREDGEGDYTQAELEEDPYDIGVVPLFPNNDISMMEALMAAALATSLASSFANAKGISQRTTRYTPAEGHGIMPSLVRDINRSHLRR
jgi:hypothetical protein